METISSLAAVGMKRDLPEFGPGDTVKGHVKVVEGEKERIQIF